LIALCCAIRALIGEIKQAGAATIGEQGLHPTLRMPAAKRLRVYLAGHLLEASRCRSLAPWGLHELARVLVANQAFPHTSCLTVAPAACGCPCCLRMSPAFEFSCDGTSLDPLEVMFVKVKSYMLDTEFTFSKKAAKYQQWQQQVRRCPVRSWHGWACTRACGRTHGT
jgi:hypothetical protein